MQVVQHYLYLPGCCYMCRSTALPTIDTGIDLDHPNAPDSDNPSANTRFYICADCAVEMARLVADSRDISLARISVMGELNGMVDALAEKNVELAARIEELENALRVVKTIQPAPDSSPAKKNFKVVAQPGEVEV